MRCVVDQWLGRDVGTLVIDYAMTEGYCAGREFPLRDVTTGSLLFTACIAVSSSGVVAVSCSSPAHCVQLLTREGALIRQIGGVEGSWAGQFSFPQGVAFSSRGDELLVCDSGNGRVQAFSVMTGAFLRFVGRQMVRPCAITVSSQGLAFICDVSDGVVLRVNLDTNEVQTMTALLQRNMGSSYHPRAVAVAPDNSVMAVCDNISDRLFTFRIDGAPDRMRLANHAVLRLSNPNDLCFLADGRLLISDRDNHRIRVLH